jgi:hypothetical protein
MLLSVTACALRNTKAPDVYSSTPICATDIDTFALADSEIEALLDGTVDNMVLINCTLHTECGRTIPDPSVCFSD